MMVGQADLPIPGVLRQIKLQNFRPKTTEAERSPRQQKIIKRADA